MVLFLAIPATADTQIRPTVVVDYTLEPAALLPGDTGTLTLSIENMASKEVYVKEDDQTFDMNAYIASITLKGNDNIKVLNNEYTDIGLLGPQDSIRIAFNIKAEDDATDGVHFLNMEVVGGSDMYDLNYNIPVKVDSRDIKLILATMPATVMNEISTVELDIVNPRPNDLNNVILIPEAEDITFNPAEVFVGNVPAGNSSRVSLTMNTMEVPAGMRNVSFTASYFNGDNSHISAEKEAPVTVVEQTSLIFTNIEVTGFGNTYTVTGDINNFGTTDAKNVLITVEGSDEIQPMQPYANYFVGTLEADDFSSFELSARVLSDQITTIPIIIEFRDTDNVYSSITGKLDIDNKIVTKETDTKTPTWIWAVTGLATLMVAGFIFYSWRRRKNPDENELYPEE